MQVKCAEACEVLFSSVSKQTFPQAGWQLAECTDVLSDPDLLFLGEAAAEEADSEDHVVFHRVSGYH